MVRMLAEQTGRLQRNASAIRTTNAIAVWRRPERFTAPLQFQPFDRWLLARHQNVLCVACRRSPLERDYLNRSSDWCSEGIGT
jgi:hypothetical protein